jgi:hypothetical protein
MGKEKDKRKKAEKKAKKLAKKEKKLAKKMGKVQAKTIAVQSKHPEVTRVVHGPGVMNKAPQLSQSYQPSLYKSMPQKLITAAAGYISPDTDASIRKDVEMLDKYYEQMRKVAHAESMTDRAEQLGKAQVQLQEAMGVMKDYEPTYASGLMKMYKDRAELAKEEMLQAQKTFIKYGENAAGRFELANDIADGIYDTANIAMRYGSPEDAKHPLRFFMGGRQRHVNEFGEYGKPENPQPEFEREYDYEYNDEDAEATDQAEPVAPVRPQGEIPDYPGRLIGQPPPPAEVGQASEEERIARERTAPDG